MAMVKTKGILLAAALVTAAAGQAWAVGEEVEPINRTWSSDGVFGTFDRGALQRGFQVFKEVCHTCHGLEYFAFRNAAELGYSEDEVRALAAEFEVTDGPDDQGEMFQRPARPSDKMPSPFPNEAAARASMGGALPPDLSLLVEARAGGADYIYSVLVGYEDPPADVEVPEGLHYNRYFPGHMIAMPPPLSEGQVAYEDGTEATVEQMAADVTEFLHFVAEPNLEARKQTGLKAMIFLVALAGIVYAYKRKVWADLH
jgi:ubiquinol-cytochrome c reductase cytochrome c1 subunit